MPLYAITPAGMVTGGPESLHQLVHKARSLGIEAYVHYFGNGEPVVPDAYKHYDVVVAPQIVDSPETVAIVPETVPHLLMRLPRSRRTVWWLSVDNFFDHNMAVSQGETAPLDRGSLEFVFDPKSRVTHLTHSEYGRIFLQMQGITAPLLSDYISPKITSIMDRTAGGARKPRVTYNPKKGVKFTQALIEKAGDTIEFLPIQNMTYEEVAETLAESMIYIDFGEHPGQDHLPKEAALAGCCVLTGTRGAAANPLDIPIPDAFKLNEATPGALDLALSSIRTILANFDELTRHFDGYRRWILSHEDLFTAQIAQIFGANGPLPLPRRHD